jgi:hypothetical protein
MQQASQLLRRTTEKGQHLSTPASGSTPLPSADGCPGLVSKDQTRTTPDLALRDEASAAVGNLIAAETEAYPGERTMDRRPGLAPGDLGREEGSLR